MIKVNKKYKDRLFRMVFSRKEDMLELYNAIAGTQYTHPDEYCRYVEERRLNIYGSRLITLPVSQYIVFYNVLKEEPDRLEMKLSSAFADGTGMKKAEPCLEFKAILLNINLGHNRELMERSRKLKEYAEFVALIRDKLQKGMTLETAADQAVDECIDSGILGDFLSVHRAEVFDMILTEYDEQRHIAADKKVSWEEGRAEGYEYGKFEAAVQLIRKKHAKKLSASQAAKELELEEVFVANVMAVLNEHEEEGDAEIVKRLKKAD